MLAPLWPYFCGVLPDLTDVPVTPGQVGGRANLPPARFQDKTGRNKGTQSK